MTPRAVLDAGRAERQSIHMGGPFKGQTWRVWPNTENAKPVFIGTKEDCHDYMLDRVFRAMLRAMADELPLDITDAQAFSGGHEVQVTKRFFLALAENDHDD